MSEKIVADTKPCVVTLEPGKYAWCTCGRSKTQPMCDGSHGFTPFKPHIFEVKEQTKMALCACKHTKNEPRCDGSHSSLPSS